MAVTHAWRGVKKCAHSFYEQQLVQNLQQETFCSFGKIIKIQAEVKTTFTPSIKGSSTVLTQKNTTHNDTTCFKTLIQLPYLIEEE